MRCAAGLLAQVQAQVVELDDAADQAVDTHGHQQRDADQHRQLRPEILPGHGAQGDGDDLGREDEVGAHRALDLVLFHLRQVDGGVGQRGLQFGIVRVGLFLVQELVGDFLEALIAQEGAADHQQRRDGPGREGADGQRRRHQDGLVEHRALGHGPHHRNLAVGRHAGDLLRVQRQVVAQHAGGFLRRYLGEHGHVVGHGRAFARGHLGHDGHVVEHGGDVVEQQKQAGGHGEFPSGRTVVDIL